jgi:hypothetical protein
MAQVANMKCNLFLDDNDKLGIACENNSNFGIDRSTGEIFWFISNTASLPIASGYCELSSKRKF